MKEVRIVFEDDEHEILTQVKNKFKCKSWHNFVIFAATVLSREGEVKE